LKGGHKLDIKDIIINNFKKLSEYYKGLIKTDLKAKFKSFQYNKAIKSLEKYNGNITKGDDLKHLEGIGNRLVQKINEIIDKGSVKIVNNINSNPNIKNKIELQKILGIGPEISKKLINKNIRTIQDLKKQLKTGNLYLSKMQVIGIKYYNDLQQKIPRDEIIYFKNIISKILNKYF